MKSANGIGSWSHDNARALTIFRSYVERVSVAVAVFTGIREPPTPRFYSQPTHHLTRLSFFVVLSSPSRQIPGHDLYWATIRCFRIFSNSPFVCHLTLTRCDSSETNHKTGHRKDGRTGHWSTLQAEELITRDITLCNRRFRRTCRLYLHHDAGSKQSCFMLVSCAFGLFFDPEDGGGCYFETAVVFQPTTRYYIPDTRINITKSVSMGCVMHVACVGDTRNVCRIVVEH
jgi:hypothetical protein